MTVQNVKLKGYLWRSIITVWSIRSAVFIEIPMEKVSHFVSAIETLLNELDNGKTTIIAGDINIDTIKSTSNDDIICYMVSMMAYYYLPYITLSSRITKLPTTSIYHIFTNKADKAKILNALCDLCYCEINDQMRWTCISMKLTGNFNHN